jgi:hypothetical protein
MSVKMLMVLLKPRTGLSEGCSVMCAMLVEKLPQVLLRALRDCQLAIPRGQRLACLHESCLKLGSKLVHVS